jgi:hypothetical protein
MKIITPGSKRMISEAEKCLLKTLDPESVEWPLIEPWLKGRLSLFIYPEEIELKVKTQVSLSAFHFEGRKYVVVLGAN